MHRTRPYSYGKALAARNASPATVRAKLASLYAMHRLGLLPARALGPSGNL